MATSGYTDVSVTSWDTLRFSWALSSQSIEKNTSTITWELKLIAGDYGRISSTASKDWAVTVNGTKYSGTNTIGLGNNATKVLASGTTTIAHNSDGKKTFSYSFSQEIAITFSGSYIGTKTGSGSATLTTIPRKSTLSVGDGTLGTEQTLTVTKQADTFTHTITYKCGNASGTIATKSSAKSIRFTPPYSLASQNTKGNTISITYKIETFNGNTSIGSNSYTKSLTIPDNTNTKASVSIVVSDETGIYDEYGLYLKGLSKLNVDVTASGSYNASIVSYAVSANGVKYTTESFTTDELSTAGANTIIALVTDSRYYITRATKSIIVTDYTPPKIDYLKAKRVNADGVEDSTGGFIHVCLQGTFAPIEGNTAKCSVRYRKSTSEEEIPLELTLTETIAGDLTSYKYVAMFEAGATSSFNITAVFSDNFADTKKNTVVSTAFRIMHWLASGLGMALGKIAELENVLDIGFQTRFHGGILQPVLDDNTDFDDVFVPNTYTVKSVNTAGYLNAPVTTGTGILKVETCGEQGQTRQVFISCSKTNPVKYERYYYQGSWGEWLTM